MWKVRDLALEVKIVIFKTTAISKINLESFIRTATKHIVNELEKIGALWWKSSIPKTKYETLCNNYKAGELKNI